MSSEEDDGSFARLLTMTVRIVTAYVAKNEVGIDGLVSVIGNTQAALSDIDSGKALAQQAAQAPAVPIERSVEDQHLICLEDGRRLKTLRRHLHAAYGMTPEQYRAKWLLPPNYPMVAPAYSRQRSEFARKSGLGKKQND